MAATIPSKTSRSSTPRTDPHTASALDWAAVMWSGVAAGALYMILQMLFVPLLLGDSPWLPVRMSAAIVLGPGVLPSPDGFAPGVFLTGMAVHFALAIAYTAVIARITHRMSSAGATITGILCGFVLYVLHFHFFSMMFPWAAAGRNALTVFSHVVFGAVGAFTYNAMVHDTREGSSLFDMRPRAPTI